jgi:DNA polymerase-3 subunit epsilon
MLPSVTYLDLETTGATPLKDRITEIALVRFDNGVEVARWQTLVNPEQPIPPFIQQLTGISDEMVEDAPTFAQVSAKLLSFIEGSVLAAHNVRFDHGFIKAEFKRLDYTLRQKVLCTVKLSRLLYPQHRSHGLDAIMARHNITSVARHRAMGDVESILSFLESAKLELGEAAIVKAVKQLMRGPELPPYLEALPLEDMPETSGVYLFYGENNLPLYIGKSVNIRARVLSHFSSEHASAKEMRINQEVKQLEWVETAGEFSALLLESRLVKEHQPMYNRQLRNEQQLYSWKFQADLNAKQALVLVSEDEINPTELGQLFGAFKSKRQAIAALRKIAETHQLCLKVLGLESGEGACFSSQIKRCKGMCCGREAPAMHNLRLQQALVAHRLKAWPFAGKIGIREYNSENNKTQIHIFEYWCYLGAVENEADLAENIQQKSELKFDLDTYKLLLKALGSKKIEIIQLPALS